ncbi:hypothetical protein JCM13304A_02000 [Desulfothermus okinawensis JCM 13304]
MVKDAAFAYQKSSIESASREDILLKLFEGGIRFLKQARELWTKGEKARARDFRSRAMAIITELHATLDREHGDKELVNQLEKLYGFMIKEMARIGVEEDFDSLKDIEEIMQKLYDGFSEAAKELKNSTS